MNINTMHDEFSRLKRVYEGDEKTNPNAARAAEAAFRRATEYYNAGSEEGFWTARTETFELLNGDRIIDILKHDIKVGVSAEKERMKKAFEEYFNKAPFDDAGHHSSNIQDPSNVVRKAYDAAMTETVATNFCTKALAAWGAMNSARQIQAMPKP